MSKPPKFKKSFYRIKHAVEEFNLSKSQVQRWLKDKSLGIEHKTIGAHVKNRGSGVVSGQIMITADGMKRIFELIDNEEI